MKEADVVLALLPQSTGGAKTRPAILLRAMPPYGDFLLCGVSTQLRQEVAGFDDPIGPADPDFPGSGLKAPSLIRLGFLAVLPPSGLLGAIGAISETRHEKLLERLSNLLHPVRAHQSQVPPQGMPKPATAAYSPARLAARVTALVAEAENDRQAWTAIGHQALSRAHGNDEPEYTVGDVR